MRILFITQYYPPETGAPQNRLAGLAKNLTEQGVEVEVLTAMPNYPHMKIRDDYKGKFSFIEYASGVKVYRAWIFVKKSTSIFLRLLNYFSFVFTAWIVSFKIKGKFDFVLCESPPLFTGMSALRIARRKNAKFIFNVSDLWPESAVKLNLVTNKFFLGLAYGLEKRLYRKSILVCGQTQGICKDIVKRFPSVNVHWLPNGVDASRFEPSTSSSWRKENNFSENDFIILYAGILGHAQGLEVVMNAAAKLVSQPAIKFVLIGNGPEKEKLIKLKDTLGLSNVFFFESVSRDQMPDVIAASNTSVVPLKKLDIFMGAIPSKIFENLAMEKPILLGVDGEARDLFIEKGKCGLYFTPEDAADLENKILQLYNDPVSAKTMGVNGRKFVLGEFNRKKISSDFLDKLSSIK